jgi:dimethylaniline monooxygenase (N-oxide forming)
MDSSTPDELKGRVCVVGAGALGLVAIKNLREQGLQVTAFEQNRHVGGTWHSSPDPTQIAALAGTRAYGSRYTVRLLNSPFPANLQSY